MVNILNYNDITINNKVIDMIENNEYIEAFTPHWNGCEYKLIFKNNGTVYFTAGCDLRPRLQTSIDKYLWEIFCLNNKTPTKLNILPSLEIELLKIEPCIHCGGALFEHPSQQDKYRQ